MITTKITISKKKVYISYCYATEIAFRNYTNQNIEDFDPKNPEHVVYLLLSAIVSYYHGKEKEEPVTSEELMYSAKPKEIIKGVEEVFKLRMNWYDMPDADKEEETESDDGETEKNG